MKKRLIVLIILLIIISIIFSALGYGREIAGAKVGKNSSKVIVVLKDGSIYGLGDEKNLKRRMISEQQQKFLLKHASSGFLITSKKDLNLRRRYQDFNAVALEVDDENLKKIKEEPDVLRVYEDRALYASLDASTSVINATTAWALIYNSSNITGSGQTVCVIDTGIDYTHDGFGNCSNSTFINGACEKVIGGYDFVNNDNDPMDDNGHGTHVAGIIASNHSIYRGVAPDSNLIAIKALNSAGSGISSDVIAGIDWCVNNASRYNITVISMSLGTTSTFTVYCDDQDPALTSSINNAIQANIAVVAASGNSNVATGISFPACIKNVTSVGATTKSDAVASYTNRNNITDLFAPGTAITSLYLTDTTTQKSGTSMATPHVSGAFSLLRQYKMLESNINLTPLEIQSVLNTTGKRINDSCDSCSNLTFSRINIFAAIRALDTTAPVIRFVDPTPGDGGTTNKNYTFINITSSEVLSTAFLEWNNTNLTMNGSSINRFINITDNSGNISYLVYGNDSSNNFGFTERRSIFFGTNTPPNATDVSINCSDSQNRTNCSLTASWLFYDLDNNHEQGNQTLWFINGSLVSSFNNVTTIGSINTSKNQNWTLSVSVFDGADWSLWSNSSVLNVKNSPPVLSILDNITINETNYANITVIALDNDNDSIIYSINDSRFSKNINFLSWKTNLSDSGIVVVRINVTDGSETAWQDVTITVNDAKDTDNDGIIDFEDADDDNDGINDSFDFIKGNSSNINSTLSSLAVTFNGSDNATNQYNATYFVQIKNGIDVFIEFNFSVSNTSILDFTNLTLIKDNTNQGSIIVSGIILPQSSTKNVFLDNVTNAHGVCIRDTEDISLDLFSQDCSGLQESFVACPGLFNQYSCTINGTRFKISGLRHSMVKQANDTTQPRVTSINTSKSGATITLNVVTDENSTCRYHTSDLNYSLMNGMQTTDGFTHSNSITYSSTVSGTYYARCNDTFGNVMDSSNTTAFSISIVSQLNTDQGTAGGSGGGGNVRKISAMNATNLTNATSITMEKKSTTEKKEETINTSNITEQPLNTENLTFERPLLVSQKSTAYRLKPIILSLIFLFVVILAISLIKSGKVKLTIQRSEKLNIKKKYKKQKDVNFKN